MAYSKNTINAILIIFIIFILSLSFRLTTVGRIFAPGHEWLTAHTLTVHKVWQQRGIVNCSFAQCMNFTRPEDHGINNAAMSNAHPDYPTDGNGVYYYFSHPPLGVIVPYITFKFFGKNSTIKTIHCFNMILGLICAIIVYLTLARITSNAENNSTIAALIAAIVFMLMPGNIWFFTNVYYIEMFAMLPISLFLYFSMCWQQSVKTNQQLNWPRWAIGFSLLMLCYTDWSGYLFAGVLFVYLIVTYKHHRDNNVILIVCLAPILALAVFVFQHLLVLDANEFFSQLARQFLYRSGISEPVDNQPLPSVGLVIDYYLLSSTTAIYLCLFLLFICLIFGKIVNLFKQFYLLLILSIIPILIHHLVLKDYTAAHYFSIQKGTYAIALMVGMLLAVIIAKIKSKGAGYLLLAGIVLVVGFSIEKSINDYNFYRYRYGQTMTYHHFVRDFVNKIVKEDEVLFFVNHQIKAQDVALIGKNIIVVESENDARKWMRININNSGKAVLIKQFTLDLSKAFVRFQVPR